MCGNSGHVHIIAVNETQPEKSLELGYIDSPYTVGRVLIASMY